MTLELSPNTKGLRSNYQINLRVNTMTTFPLMLKDGHLFTEINHQLWLVDTGSPISFGSENSIILNQKKFTMLSNYMGLSSAKLSQFVGVPCVGLLGADILGNFDQIMDCCNGTLTLSSDELPPTGQQLSVHHFMGIPIMTVQVGNQTQSMIFDTGAQLSYWQNNTLYQFQASGTVSDFFPGIGEFETETYLVPTQIGSVDFTLRYGMLPELLGMTVMMTGAEGIIGNEILLHKKISYFPRRNMLFI